jgi:predicted RNase H-like HicB family nuclease
MLYTVLVRSHPSNGYTASALAFPGQEVKAATREEALAQIRQAIEALLAEGEVVEVDVSVPRPLIASSYSDTFGMFQDDPTFDDFIKEVQKYRLTAHT